MTDFKFSIWLLLTTVFCSVVTAVEMNFQYISYIASLDQSYVSYAVWGFTVIAIFLSLFSKNFKWYGPRLSEFCMRFGLLGTVFGLLFSLNGLADIDPAMQVKHLTEGMFVSLSSTITGIIGSVVVSTYVTFLGEEK